MFPQSRRNHKMLSKVFFTGVFLFPSVPSPSLLSRMRATIGVLLSLLGTLIFCLLLHLLFVFSVGRGCRGRGTIWRDREMSRIGVRDMKFTKKINKKVFFKCQVELWGLDNRNSIYVL